jgi:hypothetical protein
MKIRLAYNIVPIKHRSCFVTGDHHRDTLGYTGTNEVSDTGTAKVVKQSRWFFCFGIPQSYSLARRVPAFSKRTDLLAIFEEHPRTLPVLRVSMANSYIV